MPTDTPSRTRSAATALAIDAVCILLFCALGRRSHAEGVTATGVLETAWPFLTGAGIGWLAARGWRAPTAPVPTGVVVWLATVVIGMLLRKATGQGTALSFIVVASVTTAILLLGWRGAAALRSRR